MVPAKFKIGDIVENVLGSKGRIIALHYSKKSWRYKVDFTQESVFIDREEFIPEENLKFYYDMPKNEKNYVPKGPLCPRCNSRWITSAFGTKKYYDCPHCKKTAEEIEKPKEYRSYW